MVTVEAIQQVHGQENDGLHPCLLTNERLMKLPPSIARVGTMFVCFDGGLEYPDDLREYINGFFPGADFDSPLTVDYGAIEKFLDSHRNIIRFSGHYVPRTELGDLLGVKKDDS